MSAAETLTEAEREALIEAIQAGSEAQFVEAVIAGRVEAAWDEGFAAGENMAHMWGHIDGWPREDWPVNPHRGDA